MSEVPLYSRIPKPETREPRNTACITRSATRLSARNTQPDLHSSRNPKPKARDHQLPALEQDGVLGAQRGITAILNLNPNQQVQGLLEQLDENNREIEGQRYEIKRLREQV